MRLAEGGVNMKRIFAMLSTLVAVFLAGGAHVKW
jgi:hypothetical protein